MNNLNNKNNRSPVDQESSIDKVKTFIDRYFKYLSTSIIVVLLIVVFILLMNGRVQEADKESDQEVAAVTKEKEFLKEDIPALDKLLSDYYVAYAQGDIATLKNYATPITAGEEQYIKTLSEHVSSSRIIETYTKEGMEEGSYAVFVKMEMGFENVTTGAPGLEFFYIKTDGQGKMYIDNAYSAYNSNVNETKRDSALEAFIEDYEDDADVEALQTEVKKSYEAALKTDEKLNTTINVTLPAAGLNASVEQAAQTDKSTEESTKTTANSEKTNKNTAAGKEDKPAKETEKTTANTEKSQDNKSRVTKIKSERVYAADSVNIRRKPTESSKNIGSALVGDAFVRTGVTQSGWSRIRFNKKEAYIKSEFLSKKKPKQEKVEQNKPQEEGPGKTYLPVGTSVTVNEALNIRVSMSETSDLVGTAAPGEVVKVVLSYAEGWTKVEWNGKTGYMKTEFLISN